MLNNSEEYLWYNPYAEEIILIAMFSNNNELLDYIFSEINEELFYLTSNKIIFHNIRKLYLDNKQITAIQLVDKLKNLSIFEEIGGNSKIIKFQNLTYSFSKNEIIGYIAILKHKFIKRLLRDTSVLLFELASRNDLEYNLKIDYIEKQIHKIRYLQSNSDLPEAQNLITPVMTQIFQTLDNSTTKYKILTGYNNLDIKLNGLERGNLVILAGRPSMGKTALGLSLAFNICKQKAHANIIIFSLEMSKYQIMNRLLVIESNLDSKTLMNRYFLNTMKEKSKKFFPIISNSEISIDDSATTTLQEISLSLQKLQTKKSEIDLVMVDYLQLIGDKKDNRAQEISFITRKLKNLARTYNVPILLLSQLNRNVEQRQNKRPILSDLKESGCLGVESIVFSHLPTLFNSITVFAQRKLGPIYSFDFQKNRIDLTYSLQGKSHGFKHLYSLNVNPLKSLLSTGNHQLFTFSGWQRVDKITENNHPITNSLMQICFINLKSITYTRKELVYNIKITPFQNFIANNILVHNSIEQDADVVLLLYRASYYNNSDENHNENHPAEIIIAKNRNGVTGTVTVEFAPKLSKFF
uniref:replication helicase subunit n=1 Tax=Rhodaphanes brevistipitata TaxID=446136 RepID=UPI001FCD05E2|nr:replication helicase subunit [Rhodaphanes brevistipitata]UNJ18503.1 replication helicase subunit [Rhodaphanes brevistipitata]